MATDNKYRIVINTSPLLFIMFVVLLTLKLAGAVNWSWWIITLPLWIVPVWVVVISGIVFILFAIGSLFSRR